MIIHSLSGKNSLMLDLTNGAMSIEKDGVIEESSISKGRPVLNKYTLVSIKDTGMSNRIKNIVSCFRIIDKLKDLGYKCFCEVTPPKLDLSKSQNKLKLSKYVFKQRILQYQNTNLKIAFYDRSLIDVVAYMKYWKMLIMLQVIG